MWNLFKNRMSKRTMTVLLLLCLALPSFATKYAGEIFHYGAGVRNLALGGTGLTNLNSTSLAWWNPALLQYATENRLEIMHAEEFEGLLKYDSFAAIWGAEKKFGLSLARIAINDIPLTKLENDSLAISNENRPYAYDNVTNSDLVAFFGFYQQIGSFTVGFSPKLAFRKLADETGFGFGADLAIVKEFSSDLMLAVQVRDFFTTRIFWSNGTDETVVPGTNLELSYGYRFPLLKTPARTYLRSEIFFEGREEAATVSFDPVSLDFHTGTEITLNKNLDFLAGYDVDHFTAGLAIKYQQFELLYAFALQPELENSHRLALNWKF
ncbi:MAG: hypothetical protein K9N06_10365 [Candidatus Cloacimonetes bacterium]|nr:hypothetical protein [Candidatus Cloacimonadota bacterium]